MPSTYTTSLKIQQIGNGEQSGVWGNTTNSNWNLIEQAIAGVVTIDMENADYTLTNLNGVPDEARNMVLKVQGINSGVRKVIAPLNQPKIYIISNETTGGYDITIGSATGSFITIPNGVTAQVYTDGTNFYSSQTGSAGDFYVNGNATVEGNLTVSGNTNIIPAGVIQMWPTTTPPAGFLLCNGAVVSRTTYAALFAVIGTTFGTIDNSTFILPNYTLRFPMGATTAASFVGSISGTTLTVTSTTGGPITVGSVISGSGVSPTTAITANLTGGFPGGVGTYTVSISQTVASTTMTGTNIYGISIQGGSTDAIVVSHTHTADTTNINHTHNFGAQSGGQSASHTHTQIGQVSGAFAYAGGGGNPGVGVPYSANGTTSGASNDHSHYVSGTTDGMNENAAHTHTINTSGSSGINANLPPFLAINYIIKT